MALIENFRNDLLGRIYEFSNYMEIKPLVDNLGDVKTFNDRFKRIHNALRSTVAALSDISSRDKKYLQTFLLGFVNPIYTKEFIYENKELYKYDSNFNGPVPFDVNGNPITFTADMIQYTYQDFGPVTSELKFTELVFKNGLLVDKDMYYLTNTAYGLKLFVYSKYPGTGIDFVEDNDDVTLVINKIYCNEYKSWYKTFIEPITSIYEIIPVSVFTPFYHTKHLKLCYKYPGMTFFKWIDPRLYNIVSDDENGTLRLTSNLGFVFPPNTSFKLVNGYSFWEMYDEITTTDVGVIPDIPLFHDPEKVKPIAFNNSYDFDVFINGYKLKAYEHYIAVPPLHTNFEPRIIFSVSTPPNTTVNIRIIKNDLFFREDSNLLDQKYLDDDGIALFRKTDKYPVMPKLGNLYISNRRIPNSHIIDKFEKVLQIVDVERTKDVQYLVRVPECKEVALVVDHFKDNKSDLDKFLELVGGIDIPLALRNGRKDTVTFDANEQFVLADDSDNTPLGMEDFLSGRIIFDPNDNYAILRNNINGGVLLTDNFDAYTSFLEAYPEFKLYNKSAMFSYIYYIYISTIGTSETVMDSNTLFDLIFFREEPYLEVDPTDELPDNYGNYLLLEANT